ncbi:AI-2E family transporter [Bombilactobacillus folatiphilus]|uniref:AI-2E family transporter n=1 Tax=Bombilactobacillus folatiphilus TaxID=2923362 RepID=A0ABY4P8P6_9LACO|nr:AI-2E family transporter [Bombilactobacillus folatiphilus]UQS81944.1 AI-2E family transporter [Bombilactobacillus folatiphilus]
MKIYQNFINNVMLRRMVVLIFCILLIWFFRDMMSIVLMTFIFTFLSINFVHFVQKFIHVSPFWIVTPLYLVILFLIYLFATHYIPTIVDSTVQLTKKIVTFYNSSQIQDNPTIASIVDWLNSLRLDEQLRAGIKEVWRYLTSVGAFGVTIVLSFILSYFYSFDLKEMNLFGRMFTKGHFAWLFEDVKFFAQKFVNTFGIVLEAQLIIAVVNMILTSIIMIILKFPGIPSLALMVFILSLIPVMGVIVSLIPLALVAYSVGGWQSVLYILIAVLLIHTLETYVLNPKLMSSRTHLPIFVTFVVLLLAERLLGTWGLIVGIPIFTFFLDLLHVRQIKR